MLRGLGLRSPTWTNQLPLVSSRCVPRAARPPGATPLHGLTMITADLISRITLFAKMPEDERASLAARAADLRLRKDEWLLVEGQTPGFYGLLEGHIDVLKVLGGREHRLTTYGPGDYFGEVPLLLGSPAIAKTMAARVSRFSQIQVENPAAVVTVIGHAHDPASYDLREFLARNSVG